MQLSDHPVAKINTIPNDILFEIIERLPVEIHDPTERFPTLHPASKKDILNVRRVWAGYRHHFSFRKLFVRVLEEHPFLIIASSMPALRDVSESEYARHMSMLSLSNLSVNTKLSGRPKSFSHWLPELLKRFPKVEHLRYYPMLRKYKTNSWEDKSLLGQVSTTRSRIDPFGNDSVFGNTLFLRGDNGITKILSMFKLAGHSLCSVTTPLLGNCGPWCAIIPMTFPNTLRRLSMNVTGVHPFNGLIGHWIEGLVCLEFLEVAVSQVVDQGQSFQYHPLVSVENPQVGQIPPLKELRIQAGSSSFSKRAIVEAVMLFPTIRRLGLAHIRLFRGLGDWSSLVDELLPLDLDVFWNLNPTEFEYGHVGIISSLVTKSRMDVARDVRWITTERPRDEKTDKPDVEGPPYIGFSIFEQDVWDTAQWD
ncbi:hypothetical protein EJ04DRAFT_566778 [Polyplosphaeria fusca]|uniref:Uncharacterized protein n=1 Tax=Polyplosphaeria fusca TaxID=682080 RepID=A0A9P4UZZ8_9PLEO|nr:hypothetical protein EJ04DRAFT_566778 [Polyplosphaeria fusca]